MTDYYYDDSEGDDDRKKDRNDEDNDAFGSDLDVPIFDLITTNRSYGGGSGNDVDVAAAVEQYICTILKMCHKLLYAKFGILDWCRCHMKTKPM